MHPAPDILHGSYLISEQSPASSHNTPVLSHTRSFNIPIYRPYVKKKFSISAKIFGIFFVQVYEINFGGNWGAKGRRFAGRHRGRPVYIICGAFFLFSPARIYTLATPSPSVRTGDCLAAPPLRYPKRGSERRGVGRGAPIWAALRGKGFGAAEAAPMLTAFLLL